ncbi:MAG: RNA-binding protein [Cyanobacteria bacterium QH_8_48_120]|jgi:RNA recognition motif-containing protein|nr:MAG: RNA-binding protein [Cyanobacteria bacterium QH_1_48_107]PSO58217.1 MAG: RNA-binding protein [Cyanobacteria bacterium QH_10_48_56]PSO62128.1 MAG: RNA-binding protein [Cyanobacteria bacterium QH_7_48_89]PSO63586.1 MAG: RNA-binding protein [Cyanobacteria bacterium QH_6_48_35]PSO66005.1 MAG: RNA-binding protein [Cyanobacteria bacterium QH_2_48_84]PSO70375.1 MAG: RNA-binding protein [Cyanobacteria bacterium QS_1_48_34]PSO70986.1 MAG: RNA-binding protein [Cyanobacteria bacterium QH_3_48_40
MCIYISNLPNGVTQEHINEVFAKYGTVKQITIPVNRKTGCIRGFGFIEMQEQKEEISALEALNGAKWRDCKLKLNQAKTGLGAAITPLNSGMEEPPQTLSMCWLPWS